MPITQSILDVAERHPGRVAIADRRERLDYAGLVADSRRTVAAVRTLGEGSRVRTIGEACGIPVTAFCLFSAFHTARLVAGLAGYRAVSAVIDPRWPIDHQAGAILSCGVSLVVADQTGLADALAARGWGGRIVSLPEFQRVAASAAPAEPPTARAGSEPFLLLFSSGTTHAPKAFVKTRYQYRQNFTVSSAHLEPLPGEATLAPGPVSYSLTLYAVIEALASGGSIHLADTADPRAAARRIPEEGVTRVVAVPALVRGLLAAARDGELAGLRLVVSGGANLTEETRRLFHDLLPNAQLISYYGAAEIGFIGDSRSGDGTLIDVYPGIGVRVASDAGEPLPAGEAGTVWVRAEACSDDYVAGTASEPLQVDGWASVHDQGSMAGGRLRLAGRAGDIITTGGHNVSLNEVERAFDGMPGLGVACAVAMPSAQLGHVVALVVEGEAPPKAELLSRARARLAPQFVPHRWFQVPRLQRTVGGKIRRGAVADQVAADGPEVVRL
ncbi:MAG TPA: fatty acid--CoA ligase family protein [Microbacteriaceae bacterium]|nr:fatty acid--CoA ligase family protein [Microbacteriaceae bacterium]